MSIMKGKQFALVYTDIFATPLDKLIICVWDSTYSTKNKKEYTSSTHDWDMTKFYPTGISVIYSD